MQALAPGAKSRHAADVRKSEESYQYAIRVHEEREAARTQELAHGLEAFRAAEQQNRDSVSAHNAQVDQLEDAFKRGDPTPSTNT